MCFILTLVFGAAAYHLLMAGNMSAGAVSLLLAILFAALMARTLLRVQKEKRDDHDH